MLTIKSSKEIKNTFYSQELIDTAVRVSELGVWEWEVDEDTLFWSDELREIYGVKPSEKITYEKYQSFLHPDDRKSMRKTINDAMKSGVEYTVEHRIVWPDSSIHWVMAHGKAFTKNSKVYRMLGTVRNIDRRKIAEQKLLESEERFRTMADTAPVLIWVSNVQKQFTYFNKVWLDFTGRPVREEQGEGWRAGIHPDDNEHCLETFNDSFDAHRDFSIECRLLRFDNEYRWVLCNGSPQFSSNKEFLGYIGSCTDIENIKRISKRKVELENMNDLLESEHDELVALNQAKDEFISLASHQLRTPATGVKQYLGMLIEGYAGKLSKEQQDMLDIAYASNERQLSIIDDLLRVAHVDSGKVILKKEATDLVDLIKDIISEQISKFKKRNQKVTFNHSAKKVFAVVDKVRLRMAIENIVDNASKYTLEGNPVIITVRETAENIVIVIKDSGVGIADTDQSKLFQKFSRITNPLSVQVSGTGMGLYWAQKIVALHNGVISVGSRLGSGSTFTITVPKK